MYNHDDENFLRLMKKVRENPQSFIFILGAGMARPVGLPTWEMLLNGMIDYYEGYCSNLGEDCANIVNQLRNSNDKWYVFEELKRQLPETEYVKYITTQLSDKSHAIPLTYELIWKLDINGIITFNIDKLILNAFSKVKHSAVDYATRKEAFKYKYFSSGDNPFVFFPHGEIADSSSWVFTETEKREAYRDSNFKSIMGTLLNSKNIVIMGFNPKENNFLSLLNDISVRGTLSGYDNYYIGNSLTAMDCKKLGDYGISCISYSPEDDSHPEIANMLQRILNYVPADIEYPSVYIGKKYGEEDIPAQEKCAELSINTLREILNGNITNIIPPQTIPTEEQICKLQDFYQKYAYQMHIAWFVNPNSSMGSQVYGYTLKTSVGRGAFGNVYEVYDEQGNKYALKILLPEVKDKVQYLSCFRRGIRSMNILRDHHVEGMVEIHSSYEVPACIVMDYVEGITLREAISGQRLVSLGKRVEILISIASIIHTAHNLKECILHRDLKPENVMLKDFYYENTEDAIQVIILDFDLSWHKGATELTVALGAMSQGFMAPEQVEENERYKRNTAVDVYSIGMLGYFLMTNENPAPYQHRFKDFRENLITSIRGNYKVSWKCLPTFLAETIERATYQEPEQRISLEGFIYNLKAAFDMILNDQISYTHSLFLREIAERINDTNIVEITDFGRTLIIKESNLGKIIRLELGQKNRDTLLHVTIQKVRMGHDKRQPKYYESAKNKALSVVDGSLFSTKEGEIKMSEVQIHLTAKLKELISLDWICKVSSNIQEVRSKLEFQ